MLMKSRFVETSHGQVQLVEDEGTDFLLIEGADGMNYGCVHKNCQDMFLNNREYREDIISYALSF